MKYEVKSLSININLKTMDWDRPQYDLGLEDNNFGIGIENPKRDHNIGTLLRSAVIFNAMFLFSVNERYRAQTSDTSNSREVIPFYHYKDAQDMHDHLPYGYQPVGVEMTDDTENLQDFVHPRKAVYLLGSEDNGLSKKSLELCHKKIILPGRRSLNVAVAGSIVMYDRIAKLTRK